MLSSSIPASGLVGATALAITGFDRFARVRVAVTELYKTIHSGSQVCSGGTLLVNVSILTDRIWQMAARFQAGTSCWYEPRMLSNVRVQAALLLVNVKVGAHPTS